MTQPGASHTCLHNSAGHCNSCRVACVPCRSLSKAIGSADTVICTIGAGGSDLSGPKKIDNEVGQSNPVLSAVAV